MDFKELHETVPYARGGKEKILKMEPYDGIILALPGRHWKETTPPGGDFCVIIDGMQESGGQFKHDQIFDDLEEKVAICGSIVVEPLMRAYLDIIVGGDPVDYDGKFEKLTNVGINPYIYLRAVQCLAVAEHRRYARYEYPQVGGRYLPFRFAAGILESEWDAKAAKAIQKRGRPGVEELEMKFGVPPITQELISIVRGAPVA